MSVTVSLLTLLHVVVVAAATADEEDRHLQDRLASWEDRWTQPEKVTFHIPEVHPVLRRFEHALRLTPASRVLVPLCGKSVDLAYFAAGVAQTVGVDGVRAALDAFVREQGGETVASWPSERVTTHRVALPAGAVDFVVGDFLDFRFTSDDGEEEPTLFDAAFDRGALVAVEPADRAAYVETLARNMRPGGRVLLVATEHEAFRKKSPKAKSLSGPPYSLPQEALVQLVGGLFDVQHLGTEERIDLDPTWRDRGLDSFLETSYLLVRTAASSSGTNDNDEL